MRKSRRVCFIVPFVRSKDITEALLPEASRVRDSSGCKVGGECTTLVACSSSVSNCDGNALRIPSFSEFACEPAFCDSMEELDFERSDRRNEEPPLRNECSCGGGNGSG